MDNEYNPFAGVKQFDPDDVDSFKERLLRIKDGPGDSAKTLVDCTTREGGGPVGIGH